METIDRPPPPTWSNLTPGHELHNLCREPLAIVKYQSCGPCDFREEDFFSIKMYMLPWQPQFQSDLPKNNMKPVLLPIDAVCVI